MWPECRSDGGILGLNFFAISATALKVKETGYFQRNQIQGTLNMNFKTSHLIKEE